MNVVKCPYCGGYVDDIPTETDIPVDVPQLKHCPEQGGCGRWFVVRYAVRYIAVTAKICEQPELVTPESARRVGAPMITDDYQPSWAMAPTAARYWAADADGKSYYYPTIPVQGNSEWEPQPNFASWWAGYVNLAGYDWRSTLRAWRKDARP